jgi:hypothetical protein
VYGERRGKEDILEEDGTKDMQTKAVDFVKETVDWIMMERSLKDLAIWALELAQNAEHIANSTSVQFYQVN